MLIGKRSAFRVHLRCRLSSLAIETRPMPESRGFPIFGTIFAILAAGGAPKLHLYIDKRHRQHGPIFREKLGPVPGVFISDGTYMRKVFTAEGKYPKHIVPESWAIYNETFGYKRGLLFMDGEEWANFRKPLNNIMLKNNDPGFADAISAVAKNLVQEWNQQEVINNLDDRLYKWSLEVIVAILLGRATFTKHAKDVGEEIEKLSRVVHQVLIESAALSLFPARLAAKFKLPVWNRFVNAVGSVHDSGQKLLQIIMKIIEKQPKNDGLLHKMRDAGIVDKDLTRIVTDLILAAADTSSYTMQWLLHVISINPSVQIALQEEVDKLNEGNITSSPLLKGALKESLRLYPVAPFITRYMPDNVFVDGYHIKPGELVLMSLYSSGRDEQYFPNATRFWPQRWLRNDKGYQCVKNPNASLPFAIGSRSCIGRKIAETQILVTLFYILKTFHVSALDKSPIGITLHLISVPERPISLILKERAKK